MADIRFDKLVALILLELAAAVEEASATFEETGERLELRVTDVDIDIPAYVRVDDGGTAEESVRLVLTLPSTREVPPAGRLGRLRLTIASNGAPPDALPSPGEMRAALPRGMPAQVGP